MNEITRVLETCDETPKVSQELFPLIYDELRQLAKAKMAKERSDHTLQATALVHEAWLKLAGSDADAIAWKGRGHFFAAASLAMRRILVDHARKRNTDKREGQWQRVTFGNHDEPQQANLAEIIDLDDALRKLEEAYPLRAKLAQLRLFGGLTTDEIAASLDLGTATVKRRWSFTKAWLGRELLR